MTDKNLKLTTYVLRLASLILLFFIFALPASAEPAHLEIIHGLASSYENVDDYTALFVKQERIRGILHREENILFKFKKPFDVYMKWLEGQGEGREILYSPQKNDGKMLINPYGLIGLIIPVINIAPDDPLVKNRTRHTIKEAGIGMAIKNLTEQCELAEKNGDLKIELKGKKTVSERPSSMIEIFFPEKELYYAGRIVVYIDEGYNLPTRIFVYDWKNRLIEKAIYTGLKLNTGLREDDFSPKNPDYGFKEDLIGNLLSGEKK